MKAKTILCAALAAQTAVAEEAAGTGGHHQHAAQPAYSEPPASPNLQNAPDAPDQKMDHEVLLTNVTIDQLEWREEDNGALEASAWLGGDRDKLWFKTEAEKEDGETEEAELQVLYSRAISPYWNLQAGVRHDFELETDSRNWGVIGLNGLAPYFFETDAALFVGEDGDSALRFESEYELLLTQRWILSPEVELNFYGQNDREAGTGSGLSDAEAGMRLRYEFTPQFAPYIGVNYEKKFGNAADFARDEGESASETAWVIGLRAWF